MASKRGVIITGGTSGTGLVIAKKFAGEGWPVVITSRSARKAEATAKALAEEFSVFTAGFQIDMYSEESIVGLYKQLEDIEFTPGSIVLNAVNYGNPVVVDPLTCDMENWTDVIRTNLIGNFMLAREAAKRMTQEGGSIVFISSNTSKEAIYSRSNYIASKGGVNALVRALAVDLGQYRIRVNALLPGVIYNKSISELPASKLAAIRSRSPLREGEWSQMEDIANGAFFLASPLSGNMTGSEMLMDGGVCARLGVDISKA